MMRHQTKFSCKRISSSENILENHILIIWSFTVTLTTEIANQSFWKTIWLILMHHNNKFGSKRFNDSEDIVWANIHWHFKILQWIFALSHLSHDLPISTSIDSPTRCPQSYHSFQNLWQLLSSHFTIFWPRNVGEKNRMEQTNKNQTQKKKKKVCHLACQCA